MPNLDDLDDLLNRYGVPADDGGEGGDTPDPAYTTLVDWVDLWLAHVIERRIRTATGADSRAPARWCPTWWRHPEVVDRLGALWHAWESSRLDPATGMSTWWRDHLDPHWHALTHELGPMNRCTTTCAGPTPPLPVEPPPDGWQPPID